jgi:hypothetical protein
VKQQQRRSSASFVVSVVFHAALAVVLANVVVHYEIVFQRQVQVFRRRRGPRSASATSRLTTCGRQQAGRP